MKLISKIKSAISANIYPLLTVLLAASICYFYYVVIESVSKIAKLSLEISQTQENNIKVLNKTKDELGECKRDLEKIRNDVEQ